MFCYMKIDDLILGFFKGFIINVFGIFEKINGNVNISLKLCFE